MLCEFFFSPFLFFFFYKKIIYYDRLLQGTDNSILCTNRDEFLDRPTQNAQFHSFGADADPHQVLSGRDELAGGTWFGINRTGKVALL